MEIHWIIGHLFLLNLIMLVMLIISIIAICIVARANSKFSNENIKIVSIQQRLASILDNAAESILTFDKDGAIENFNRSAELLFGYCDREVCGKKLSLLITGLPKNFYCKLLNMIGDEMEFVGRNQAGNCFPISIKFSFFESDGQKLYTAIIADIRERKKMIDRLQYLAEHDGLTGLYNRRYFLQKLNEILELIKRGGSSYAVVFLDLDDFKMVNDTFGHAGGDYLLAEVAKLLMRDRRKSDCVARLGGDEFAMLLHNADSETAIQIAESIRASFEEHIFNQNGRRISLASSFGVFIPDERSANAEEALYNADLACYAAKQNGRNRSHLFAAKDMVGVNNAD